MTIGYIYNVGLNSDISAYGDQYIFDDKGIDSRSPTSPDTNWGNKKIPNGIIEFNGGDRIGNIMIRSGVYYAKYRGVYCNYWNRSENISMENFMFTDNICYIGYNLASGGYISLWDRELSTFFRFVWDDNIRDYLEYGIKCNVTFRNSVIRNNILRGGAVVYDPRLVNLIFDETSYYENPKYPQISSQRYTKHCRMNINYSMIAANEAPSLVTRGIFAGYIMPIWNNTGNSEQQIFVNGYLPTDWDRISNLSVVISGWIDTEQTSNSGENEFKLEVAVSRVDQIAGELVPDTPIEYTQTKQVHGWDAYKSYKMEIVLDNSINNIQYTDMLAMRIRRLEADNNDIDGELIIENIYLKYEADKPGEPI